MIYLERKDDKEFPVNFETACVWFHAIENNLDWCFTTQGDVEAGFLDKKIRNYLFCGSVQFMQAVFKRVGLDNFRLPLNSNRQSEIQTIEQIKKRVFEGKERLFIKPVKIKSFPAQIIDDKWALMSLAFIPLSELAFVYPVFDKEILSEWRVYVHRGKFETIKNYSGNPFGIPSIRYVEGIIKENKAKQWFPETYCIDVGILEDFSDEGESVVIEYNDMWAIGNYGVDNELYTRMLKTRYSEIMERIAEK